MTVNPPQMDRKKFAPIAVTVIFNSARWDRRYRSPSATSERSEDRAAGASDELFRAAGITIRKIIATEMAKVSALRASPSTAPRVTTRTPPLGLPMNDAMVVPPWRSPFPSGRSDGERILGMVAFVAGRKAVLNTATAKTTPTRTAVLAP